MSKRKRAPYRGKSDRSLGSDLLKDAQDLERQKEREVLYIAACLEEGGFGRNEVLPNGRVVWVQPSNGRLVWVQP